jgi:3-oxoacyl-[acyl-carrier protein] reductase
LRAIEDAVWARTLINITTDAARAFATQIAYGASKYALEGFTRSIAIEAGNLKITVNAIAPGPIQTGWITPELQARVLPAVPLGRVGPPEDVADAVVFLASKQARWITGHVIQVADGHAL